MTVRGNGTVNRSHNPCCQRRTAEGSSSSGKPTLWKFYEKGQLVRKERDTNGDGKVDYWEYWENGQVDRVGEDLDGDGQVDKWTKNPNSES